MPFFSNFVFFIRHKSDVTLSRSNFFLWLPLAFHCPTLLLLIYSSDLIHYTDNPTPAGGMYISSFHFNLRRLINRFGAQSWPATFRVTANQITTPCGSKQPCTPEKKEHGFYGLLPFTKRKTGKHRALAKGGRTNQRTTVRPTDQPNREQISQANARPKTVPQHRSLPHYRRARFRINQLRAPSIHTEPQPSHRMSSVASASASVISQVRAF